MVPEIEGAQTETFKILKLKITPGDIIILHISTINDNHMVYDF